MPEEAWGRWGPDDERGALNLIDSDAVRAAVKLVRSGKVFSLGATDRELHADAAAPAEVQSLDDRAMAAITRRARAGRAASPTLKTPCRCRCIAGPISTACVMRGTGSCSTTVLPRAGSAAKAPSVSGSKDAARLTRGVLLDIAASAGGLLRTARRLRPINAQRAAAPASHPDGRRRIDTNRLVGAQSGRQETDFNSEPGLNVEAALLLAECGAAVVGADNFAIEAMPFPEGTAFPVHQRLIRDYGVPLLEGLVLAALAAAGATTFLFVAAPLPVVGGTGSPVAPVAIV